MGSGETCYPRICREVCSFNVGITSGTLLERLRSATYCGVKLKDRSQDGGADLKLHIDGVGLQKLQEFLSALRQNGSLRVPSELVEDAKCIKLIPALLDNLGPQVSRLSDSLVYTISVEEKYSPLVGELKAWIGADTTRRTDFETAIETARSHNTIEMRDIHSLEDYFKFVNKQLFWIPSEAVQAKDLLFRLLKMWFVLDQPSVIRYQCAIRPSLGIEEQQPDKSLTWLSTWMVQYSNEIGKFMDKPKSAAALHTFKTIPSYNIDDYIEPRGGWRTFNEFFARHVKPGRRPIASIGDNSVLTSPADFEFKEAHTITPDSTVTSKGLAWPIAQMFVGSVYRDRFANGVWLHGFLNVDDYHRVHTPVSGKVLEARIIPGQNYMQVVAAPNPDRDGITKLCIPNETGYQFCQSRGLVVMDTGSGLVAVLPVGMAIVSSVVLTAEVGIELHKGEELGYFQFGGSDVVLVFEARLGVEISMEKGQHYRMGREIGRLNGSSIG